MGDEKVIYIILGIIAIVLLVRYLPSPFAVVNTECFQGFANVSTVCGGLSTGTYYDNGNWDDPSKLYVDADGHIAGKTRAKEGTTALFIINYSKPVGASPISLWKTYFNGDERNLAIPSDCWNASPVKISFRIKQTWRQAYLWETWLECWNGQTWNLLNHETLGSGWVDGEAMIWNIETSAGGSTEMGCYQEFANVSTACGGLDTGKYGFQEQSYPEGYFFINYTKPNNFNSAQWRVRLGYGEDIINLNIPPDCWGVYPDKLVLRMASSQNDYHSTAECYNGSWKRLFLMTMSVGSGSCTPGATCSTHGSPNKNNLYDGNWDTYSQYYSAASLNKEWRTGAYSDYFEVYEEAIIWIYSPSVNIQNQSLNLQLGTNQLLAMETFAGGTTISKTSMRYPVVFWGGNLLPVIVITSGINTVTTDSSIYSQLESGNAVQIPANQVWSLFYVVENNYQLPTICQVVDVSTNQCAQINPGIMTVCSEGQFDPARGLCVIQPDSTIVCPEGGRYDTAQAKCIINPPIAYICTQGIYNVNSGKCEYTPATSYVCSTGSTYNPTTGKCESFPASQIICPGGYAYDAGLAKCVKYPNTQTICPSGTTYNSVAGTCQYTPTSQAVCSSGYTYNPSSNKCEYTPPTSIICGSGIYNPTMGRCEYTPSSQPICPSGTLTQLSGDYICAYTPQSMAVCPSNSVFNPISSVCEYYPSSANICDSGFIYNSVSGFCEQEATPICVQGTYNSQMNACVVNPNLQYLCINGELTSDNKCTITAEETIVCANGFTYNSTSDKCTKYPDYWETGLPAEPTKTFDFANFWNNYKWWIIGISGVIILILIIGKKK